jgi:ATP-binding protein involved in chromosome partitioning
MAINFLGEIPLDPVVRVGGDTGRPVAMRGESDERAAAFFDLAKRTVDRVALESATPAPQITIEE